MRRETFTMSFFPQFVSLGLPMVFRALLSNVLFILNNIMVGSLGETHLAAISQAGQLGALVNTFLYGIVAASTVFLTQLWGKKDLGGFREALGRNLLLSFLVSAPAVAVAALWPRAFLGLYLEGDAIEYGAQYLRILWPLYPLMGIAYTFSAGSDSAERVRLPMAAGMASILVSTALNFLLIFGGFGLPALGIRGAAVATVCGASLEAAILVVATYLRRAPGALRFRDLRLRWDAFGRFAKTAAPILVNEGGFGLGQTFLAMVYGRMGTAVVAALAIAGTLERFMQMPVKGVVHAGGILVGKMIGQGRDEDAYRCGKQAMRLSTLLAAGSALAVLLVRGPVLGLFHVSGETLQIASRLVVLLAAMTPGRMLLWSATIGTIRAGGDAAFVMGMDMVGMWAFSLPLSALTGLVLGWPIEAVYGVLMLEESAKAALSVWRFRTRKWIRHLA